MSKFVTLLVGMALASLGALAQDSSSAPPAANPPATIRPQHQHQQGDRAEQRLKRLSKRLSLTDDQQEKMRPILQDEDKQISDLEADTTMTAQQKHKKIRDIRMASKSQMDGILTDEQKAKMPAGRTYGEGRHRMPPGKANGTTPSTSDSQ